MRVSDLHAEVEQTGDLPEEMSDEVLDRDTCEMGWCIILTECDSVRSG
jgi:hypothetical protein